MKQRGFFLILIAVLAGLACGADAPVIGPTRTRLPTFTATVAATMLAPAAVVETAPATEFPAAPTAAPTPAVEPALAATPTVAPTDVPTATPVPPTAEPTATTAPPIVATEPPGLQLVQVSSPVAAGSNATVVVQTVPGASCAITVEYKSGPSDAAGLESKAAGGDGVCSWSWEVGTRTTPGEWPITIRISIGGQSNSLQTSFVVQ